jgi:hypothetical protein
MTGYDNAGFREFYRYSTSDDSLSCVSCNPTGIAPSGNASLGTPRSFLREVPLSTFLTRNLSASGNRIFFESPDPLVSADTNGVDDVYEWEAEGTGSCGSATQNGGCIYLLSTGTSPDPSYFGDADEEGENVFFFTSQGLVPQDQDQLVDVYDARVEGGLPSQYPTAGVTCSGEACRGEPSNTPGAQAPGSLSPIAAGNNRPRKCGKHKRRVVRRGKELCVKHRRRVKHRHHRKLKVRHGRKGGQG